MAESALASVLKDMKGIGEKRTEAILSRTRKQVDEKMKAWTPGTLVNIEDNTPFTGDFVDNSLKMSAKSEKKSGESGKKPGKRVSAHG